MKLPLKKQIEIYDYLDARHTVTDSGVDNLSWEQISEIAEIIKRKTYERTINRRES